jgi:GH15 family glucan-1,4-alpha-glucosidase
MPRASRPTTVRVVRRIADYALIGDLCSAALVSADGSVDWLCLPRFDSPACLAALLGEDRHGHWRLAPAGGASQVTRRYLPGTLILQTDFATEHGSVRITDCMPPRSGDPALIRVAEGLAGTVRMRMTLAPRFEYGLSQPAISRHDGACVMAAGPEALWLFGPAHVHGHKGTAIAEFEVGESEKVPFTLIWRPPRLSPPRPPLPEELIRAAHRFWTGWSARLNLPDRWQGALIRSLITVRALTYAPTGGLVAAPTTSLPARMSSAATWDYRYCWLRDGALAQDVLLRSGAVDEARRLIDWMARATAGPPAQLQNLYGPAGERLLPEIELEWLPGHGGARPVRIGNAAAAQPPLAAFGEVQTARLRARMAGLPDFSASWSGDRLLSVLESAWRQPDRGIWEVRDTPRQFVHTKAMVWAAADAAVKMIERFGDSGPARRWRLLRSEVRAEVLRRGYDTGRGTFVLAYDLDQPDASLLRLCQLGLLAPGDDRARATIETVERELDRGGVVARHAYPDGTHASDAGYLPASFWLAECLTLLGRVADASKLLSDLLSLSNDVGLLGEAYDPLERTLAGNFPLAASHLGLVSAVLALDGAEQGGARS